MKDMSWVQMMTLKGMSKEMHMKAKDKILRKIKRKMNKHNLKYGQDKSKFDVNDILTAQTLMEYFGIDVGEYNKTIHKVMEINFANESKENNDE